MMVCDGIDAFVHLALALPACRRRLALANWKRNEIKLDSVLFLAKNALAVAGYYYTALLSFLPYSRVRA